MDCAHSETGLQLPSQCLESLYTKEWLRPHKHCDSILDSAIAALLNVPGKLCAARGIPPAERLHRACSLDFDGGSMGGRPFLPCLAEAHALTKRAFGGCNPPQGTD